MKRQYFLLLPLFICMSGCSTAFEVGEALNRATTNIANNPKVIWDTVEPASAPVSTDTSEVNSVPQEVNK